MSEKQRMKIVKELATTEATYVDRLHLLNEFFVQPLLTKTWSIMKNPAVAIFLSNVETLYMFHDKFLRDVNELAGISEVSRVSVIEEEENETTTVKTLDSVGKKSLGSLFLSYIGLFKLYHPYSRNYDVAMPLFAECRDGHFTFFMQDSETQLGETMESLAICPIQRIPRYILLLKELTRCFEESDEEFILLTKAITELETSAMLINESIRGRQQLNTLVELERKFSSNGSLEIVKLGRRIVKEGIIQKVCKTGARPFYFHLFNDILVYSEESSVGFKPHRAMDLRHMKVDNRVSGCQTKISFVDTSFTVVFENETMRADWIDKLTDTIQSQDNPMIDIPFYWQNDDEIESCQLCESNFSIINRRNSCKKCGLVVCGNCSKHKLIVEHINLKSPVKVCSTCFEQEVNAGALNGVRKEGDKKKDKLGSTEFHLQKKFSTHDLLLELQRTEREFLKRLDLLSQLFIEPVLQDLYISVSSASSTSGVGNATFLSNTRSSLIDPKVAVLFTNIEQISTLNHEFSDSLEDRVAQWNEESTIGDLFIQYAPLFKLYSQYARFYHFVLLEMSKDKFPSLIEKAEKHRVALKYGLDVEQFLLQPMQRIPIYELFIYEVEKRTEKNTLESVNLNTALELVRDCTVHINASREIQGKLDVLRDLENKFTTQVTIVSPQRELVKTGYLTKCDRRGNGHKLLFHLFSDMLIYSKESLVGLQLRRSMDITRIRISEQKDTKMLKNAFVICNTEKSFLVYADTPEIKDEWMRSINAMAARTFVPTNVSSPLASGFGKSTKNSSVAARGRRNFGKSVDLTRKPHMKRTISASLLNCDTQSASVSPTHSGKSMHSALPSFGVSDEQIIIVKDYNGIEFPVDLSRAPLYSFSKQIKACSVCNEDLRIMRRNHCDSCGRAVCKRCSQRRVLLPHGEDRPKKACDACFTAMEGMQILSERLIGNKSILSVEFYKSSKS